MNFAKFFFTLTFFFSLSVFAQAQVETVSNTNEATITTTVNEMIPAQSEVINANNSVPAESNTQTITSETNTIAFSFNHKQFLKPVIRKRAYC